MKSWHSYVHIILRTKRWFGWIFEIFNFGHMIEFNFLNSKTFKVNFLMRSALKCLVQIRCPMISLLPFFKKKHRSPSGISTQILSFHSLACGCNTDYVVPSDAFKAIKVLLNIPFLRTSDTFVFKKYIQFSVYLKKSL